MNAVRIYFKVLDFSKWKQTFEEDKKSGLLQKAGIEKYTLHRIVGSPNEPTLYLEVKDIGQIKEFFSSDIAKNRMKEAGVVGEPRFVYLEKIEENSLGEAVPKVA